MVTGIYEETKVYANGGDNVSMTTGGSFKYMRIARKSDCLLYKVDVQNLLSSVRKIT